MLHYITVALYSTSAIHILFLYVTVSVSWLS